MLLNAYCAIKMVRFKSMLFDAPQRKPMDLVVLVSGSGSN